ncbi:MAG: hypothetical protein M5U09_23130 [Gammaproteobacteria bacterium]|nr:hypothetical protein [Gammaproteobacteria bacterium]
MRRLATATTTGTDTSRDDMGVPPARAQRRFGARRLAPYQVAEDVLESTVMRSIDSTTAPASSSARVSAYSASARSSSTENVSASSPPPRAGRRGPGRACRSGRSGSASRTR